MNSLSEGWSLFKIAIRCARNQRALALGIVLYATSFMGISLTLAWLKIGWAPVIHIFVMPLLAYFLCRLHEDVVLGSPSGHPLLKRLKSDMGPILLIGLVYSVLNVASATTIKALSAQGAGMTSMVAVLLGALLNWVLGIVLNLALWQMAIQSASLPKSLWVAFNAFFSNIKTFISVTAAMILVMLPGLIFVAIQLGLRLLVLQGTIHVDQTLLVGLMITSIVFLALSVICVLALNVFVTYEMGRRFFEDSIPHLS